MKSWRAAIRASGAQWAAILDVSAIRKRRYAIVTSRRVGLGSGGIESAKVRLVFPGGPRGPPCSGARREKAGEEETEPLAGRNDAPAHREEPGQRARVNQEFPCHRRAVDGSVDADAGREEARELLVERVRDRAEDHVRHAATRAARAQAADSMSTTARTESDAPTRLARPLLSSKRSPGLAA